MHPKTNPFIYASPKNSTGTTYMSDSILSITILAYVIIKCTASLQSDDNMSSDTANCGV